MELSVGIAFRKRVFGVSVSRYHFEDNGDDDWMTRYFFTGGTMPSLDLFLYFQQHLAVQSVSYVNGVHYSRTLEQWLQKQDRTEKELMPIFKVRFTWPSFEFAFMCCCSLLMQKSSEQWAGRLCQGACRLQRGLKIRPAQHLVTGIKWQSNGSSPPCSMARSETPSARTSAVQSTYRHRTSMHCDI